jgi:predicted N-acetyltransferase YhbS
VKAVQIRPMAAKDAADADVIFRLAFGKEFGLADPLSFRGDARVVSNRFRMYPDGCVIAEADGRVIGFSVASRWGSMGVLGPVCVHPDFWNQGLARRLVAESVATLDAWGCRASGLFTNPTSPRHLRLYQAFGFWPRHLTLAMARPTASHGAAPAPAYRLLSEEKGARLTIVKEAKKISERVFAGMDLGREIESVVDLRCGDTILIDGERGLEGFAVCHYGVGSEGGSASVYVKFAMVRPDDGAAASFLRLVRACTAHAAREGIAKIIAGVNTARHDAYRVLIDEGFRSEAHGVRMHRPLVDVYDTPSDFVIDDLR